MTQHSVDPFVADAIATTDDPAPEARNDRRADPHQEIESDPDRPLVTIVVPAFNEELKIEHSLTAIHAYMEDLAGSFRFEIVVVDDGSIDDTAAIVDDVREGRPRIRMIRQPSNMGIGQALRDGFADSNGDIVVAFDADLSYAVDHIGAMIEALRNEHAAVAVASPYMKGGRTSAIPWRREVMSKQVNRLLSATSHYPIKTITGMVRAYDGNFIRGLSLKSRGPEINTEILYKAQILRARVAEVPAHLDWSDQAERIASRRVSLRVSRTSKLLVFASFLYRPILFFIIPGLLLLTISMWSTLSLAITVVQNARGAGGGIDSRLTHGFADAWELRPQTFIIAGFTFVAAAQLISLGLLATQAKRYFEELFFAASRTSRPSRPSTDGGRRRGDVGP